MLCDNINMRSLDLILDPHWNLPGEETGAAVTEETSVTPAEDETVYSENVAVGAEQTIGTSEVMSTDSQPIPAALLFIPIFAAAVITAAAFALSESKKTHKDEKNSSGSENA